MVLVIQGNLKMGKKQERGNLNMVTVLIIQEHFITINYMEKVNISGVMGENIMEIGNLIV
jgi:hypothetical protein